VGVDHTRAETPGEKKKGIRKEDVGKLEKTKKKRHVFTKQLVCRQAGGINRRQSQKHQRRALCPITSRHKRGRFQNTESEKRSKKKEVSDLVWHWKVSKGTFSGIRTTWEVKCAGEERDASGKDSGSKKCEDSFEKRSKRN